MDKCDKNNDGDHEGEGGNPSSHCHQGCHAYVTVSAMR